MHEVEKMKEAEFFYSKMLESKEDRKPLEYYISAFLTPARSVLQYTLVEARTKKGGQGWYDKVMAGSKVLQFFKCSRDVNIHEVPASTDAHIRLHITDRITITDSVNIDGTPDSLPRIGKVEPVPDKPSVIQEVSYRFGNWCTVP